MMLALKRSFSCAFAGLIYCLRTQRNMRIHLGAALAAVILAVICRLSTVEWGLLVLTIFMVWVAEAINTAIEKTVDLVTKDFHPVAGLAKNIAAGGVLLAAINSVVMAGIIFGSRIVEIIFK